MALFSLETMEDSHFGGEQLFINFPEDNYFYAADFADNIRWLKTVVKSTWYQSVVLYILSFLLNREVKDEVKGSIYTYIWEKEIAEQARKRKWR